MSLIEDQQKGREEDGNRLAVRFFKEVLVPLALRERAAGKTFFPLRPDADAESYYVEPTHGVMSPSDFELLAAESIEDFINELAVLWVSEGHEELASMSPGLSELAKEVSGHEDQAADVSAFMYVMF